MSPTAHARRAFAGAALVAATLAASAGAASGAGTVASVVGVDVGAGAGFGSDGGNGGNGGDQASALERRLAEGFARAFSGRGLNPPAPVVGGVGQVRPMAPDPAERPFASLSADGFAAYAAGTTQHVDAILASEDVRVTYEVGMSDAAHTSEVLPAWDDETAREAFPTLGAGRSHARGSAVELLPTGRDGNQVSLPEPAVAQAPPSSSPVVNTGDPVGLSPAVEGSTARAEAAARAIDGGCVLGADSAVGLGSADGADVADLDDDPESPGPLLSISVGDPDRAVSQSLSRTRLTPIDGRPGRFGVLAETRQTIAPVTIFDGYDDLETTIEVGGEWALQAAADGETGTVTLGVDGAPDDLPLLRITFPDGPDDDDDPDVVFIYESQLGDVAAAGAILVPGTDLEVVIGEAPRQLRGKTASNASGTRAAGAVDVLRVQFTNDVDAPVLRVGHMEAGAAAPQGGVACPGISVAQRTTPTVVEPGGEFTWSIEVYNPNDCRLTGLRVVDRTAASAGVDYDVASTAPQAYGDKREVTFSELGPLDPGQSTTLLLRVLVGGSTDPGSFTNEAVATGVCGAVEVFGATEHHTTVDATGPLAVEGATTVDEPDVVRSGSGAAGDERGDGPATPGPGGGTATPGPGDGTATPGTGAGPTTPGFGGGATPGSGGGSAAPGAGARVVQAAPLTGGSGPIGAGDQTAAAAPSGPGGAVEPPRRRSLGLPVLATTGGLGGGTLGALLLAAGLVLRSARRRSSPPGGQHDGDRTRNSN